MDIATIAIIAINALVSLKGFNDRGFFDKYKFNIAGIQRGEQVRFVTSAFLHADFQHLAFNMITLFFFAGIVVTVLGTPSFLLIYTVSLLTGNFLSYFLHKHEYDYSAIGASGAVSGIIYSAILLFPEMRIYGFIPGYIFGLGYMIYTIYGMKNKTDNIGHDAHFGGAAGGLVATIIYAPALIYEETLTVVLLLVPIVALFVLIRTGKLNN
jgi:membrane associated rhomboid family serine protease